MLEEDRKLEPTGISLKDKNVEPEEIGCKAKADRGDADENDNMTSKRIRSSPDEANGMGNNKIQEGPREKLDVPSDEMKCIRKQVLIEKLMSSQSKLSKDGVEAMEMDGQSADPSGITQSSKSRGRNSKAAKDEQAKKTFKLRSSVLDRVKTFLPEFKTSNEKLVRHPLPDASKLSLESDTDEMDGKNKSQSLPSTSGAKAKNNYVEMSLALVEHSDSDSDSDLEDLISKGAVRGLPSLNKTKNQLSLESENTPSTSNAETKSCETNNESKLEKSEPTTKPLITELS